jgi:ABC-type Fe3+/spermidine/putrescine transport system ATPase subunit
MADELMVLRAGSIEERGDPRDIYEHPTTAFGASFLGAKNVVYGRVVRMGQPFSVAQVGSEHVVFTSRNPLKIGDSVELRWRREHLRLRMDCDTGIANQWRCKVVSAVYLGHRWEVSLDCLGASVRAWSDSEVSGTTFAEVSPNTMLGYASTKRAQPVHDTS